MLFYAFRTKKSYGDWEVVDEKICHVCFVRCKTACSGCRQVYYCSIDHQTTDWDNHKKKCLVRILKRGVRDEVYPIVSKDGLLLEHVPQHLKKDFELVNDAVMQNAHSFRYADDELKKHKGLVLNAVKRSFEMFRHADYSLRDDRKYVYRCILQAGCEVLSYASESVRSDRELIMSLINEHGEIFLRLIPFASESVKTDKKFLLKLVKKFGMETFRYIDSSLVKERNFMLDCIREKYSLLEYFEIRSPGILDSIAREPLVSVFETNE